MQKEAAKSSNHTSDWDWETSAQRRKRARICAMFKACTREQAWKSIGDKLNGPCYLSRDDTIVKSGPENKEHKSVNTPLSVGQ